MRRWKIRDAWVDVVRLGEGCGRIFG